MIAQHIFREYDIRGTVGNELTADTAFLLGRGFGTHVKNKYGTRVTVGGDVRISTPMLQKAFIDGLMACGISVIDLGATPTPAQYFSIQHLQADAGVQITGSHNPPEFNGFKMTSKTGSIFGDEITTIKNIIIHETFAEGKGAYVSKDILSPYCQAIVDRCDFKRRLKVVLDAGNGAAALVLQRIFEQLNVDAEYLFAEPDGTFPNHHPDPTVPENLKDLVAKVKESNADMGIGFDGDADRLGVVNPAGDIIWGDKLMILYAREIIARRGNVPIVFDVKCSQSLAEEVAKAGGTPVMWKTGHSLVKQKMKELQSPLGGEMSGHIFFADEYYGYDDALYAAARTIRLMANSNQTIDEMLADITPYQASPEIRLNCSNDEDKFAIVAAAKAYYSATEKVIDVDGVRIIYPDGWALVRASNTQPVIVVRFEAQSAERLAAIREAVLDKLRTFGSFTL
jgi:phosphomannomutase/phosphoglucomutase